MIALEWRRTTSGVARGVNLLWGSQGSQPSAVVAFGFGWFRRRVSTGFHLPTALFSSSPLLVLETQVRVWGLTDTTARWEWHDSHTFLMESHREPPGSRE